MTRLAGEPFALLGVHSNPSDAAKLKALKEKDGLNWRSFAGSEALYSRWNRPPTPAYYLIDPAGIIRRKWVGYPGEEALDRALAGLLREARRAGLRAGSRQPSRH